MLFRSQEEQRLLDEKRAKLLREKDEEEARIKEENRRIKEWEDKFDQEQRVREEELIKKFYSDHSKSSITKNESKDDVEKEEKN